jgi:hypothetical protein
MIRRTSKTSVHTLCLMIGILTALYGGSLWAGESSTNNPGVMPPNSTPLDRSYPEWHLAWWNWALSMPRATNPLLNADDPGDQATAALPVWIGPYDASAGQSGHMWFLAETHQYGWTVERDATIPAGKHLCFPLQNYLLWGWPPLPEAEAWMRFYLGLVLDTAEVACEIDGVPIANVERYRHQSPAVPLVVGENNFLRRPAGQYGMMVDDGYYLIVAPLSVGTHTIHWTASMALIPFWLPGQDPPVPPFPVAFQEVTYHITVVRAAD